MREMIRGGDLGALRLVQVEYAQDWLTGPTEKGGNKQAEWRVDPNRSGAGGALGDVGTHAFNLADYVTGLEVSELAADLTVFGEGRTLDDNAPSPLGDREATLGSCEMRSLVAILFGSASITWCGSRNIGSRCWAGTRQAATSRTRCGRSIYIEDQTPEIPDDHFNVV